MKRYRPHLLVLCVLAVVLLSGIHTTLQNALTDMRFGWFLRQASGDIVLVTIDSTSIDKIGVWPWPRQIHAKLIDKLESAGASIIAFDIDFSSQSNPTSDQSFVDALQKAGGSVVLSAFSQSVGDRKNGRTIHVNRPLPQFDQHAWSAIVNVKVGPDGLVRHYSFGETLDGTYLPSLGALLAGHYETNKDSGRIDFSIRGDSVPTVSYADVLSGNSDAFKRLQGKKVIIGATALELGDRFNVPRGHVISGSLLQALAAESIVQSRVLRTSSNAVVLSGLGFIAILMLMLWGRLSASLRVVVLVGLACAVELGAVLLQAKLPIILDTSLWHSAIAAYLFAMALDEIDFRELLGRIAEKRFQRIAMSIGDGLVCADRNCRITAWNPGAMAIFGYESEEMIGQPLDRICALGDSAEKCAPFSLLDFPPEVLQAPGGKVLEFNGRRKNGDVFPLDRKSVV
jgi:PAS domain S-box-containing protein